MKKFTPFLIGILLFGIGLSLLHTHDAITPLEPLDCVVCLSQSTIHTNSVVSDSTSPKILTESVDLDAPKCVFISRVFTKAARGPPA